MSERATDGVWRLRTAGIGVVIGGLLLAVTATVLAYALAAGIVLAAGVLGFVLFDRVEVVQGSVGVSAVGAIGLVEATPGIGLGLEPALLAGIAVVFGVFDVLASLVLHRIRSVS